ncbi:alpha/beta hydrolase [Mucilaginibacter sp. UR6-11]|uniref:alpha/beta hydrolase n=1 Tax=Mucilaginibacter sp. UR6-11 TaxID=1435644 RepID=UPI001E2D5B14|nr:alpha/beta hydrolase [Mucilaginibacter sp. UR6-11]MCC8425100.1 alpha/beta hydrolase [Mucilaginibacter sp. UR6-11]
MRRLIFTFFTFAALSTQAQEVKQIPLYPDGIPNSKPTPATYVENDANGWARTVSIPTLIPFPADKSIATGTAIVICPGGGYGGLSMDNEGTSIAKAFNQIGVTAFVLKYRLPSDEIMIDKTIGPLQDAQAAIQMVRSKAAAWGINPAKIGIIGFSAGGHLASTAETHFKNVVIPNKDNISVRPDFAILMYPVITFGDVTHQGSKDNLIGKNPPAALVDLYSNEKQVTPDTPPTFIVMAEDDGTVPVENALLFYNAMIKAKVKGELHIYQAGGHGFGINNKTSKEKWFDWCKSWLNNNGF